MTPRPQKKKKKTKDQGNMKWSRAKVIRKTREFNNRRRRWPTESDLGKDGLPDLEKVRAAGFDSFQTVLVVARGSSARPKIGMKSTDALHKRLPGSFEHGKRQRWSK